jgi:cytochrome c5
VTDFPTTDEMVRDLIVLIIGVLVAVVIGIFIFTNQLGSDTQEAMNRQDPAYQAAVLERIKPYGRVVLDGETDAENAAPVAEIEEAVVVLTGPQVYNQACTACHSTGAGGAPKVAEAADWGPRISAGMATLNDRAINGFQGSAGVMPAKGGFTNLSDDEIIAAVQYMVDESN